MAQKGRYNHPEVDRIYGLHKKCVLVHSKMIFYLLLDGCRYSLPTSFRTSRNPVGASGIRSPKHQQMCAVIQECGDPLGPANGILQRHPAALDVVFGKVPGPARSQRLNVAVWYAHGPSGSYHIIAFGSMYGP